MAVSETFGIIVTILLTLMTMLLTFFIYQQSLTNKIVQGTNKLLTNATERLIKVEVSNDDLQKNKGEVENKYKEHWVIINTLKDLINKQDNHHAVLCQKHEDAMIHAGLDIVEQDKELAQHKLDITRVLTLHTEMKKEFDSKIHIIENSLRSIAQQRER